MRWSASPTSCAARCSDRWRPRYAEYAELIHESGGHLLDLINDVLDLSKIEAERYELSIGGFRCPRRGYRRRCAWCASRPTPPGVELRGVLGPERIPVKVKADRRALKQIVLNLVSNALKFTPAGGFVTVGLRSAQGALELAVGDTGVGISTEDLERLGRPYQQAGDAAQRAKGSGLGLSLVRALSELHGGEMTISSTLGSGTIVVVRLPVIAEDSAEAEILGAPIGENIIAFNPKR
jgi:cell cycle sensor histidine kinase DivJ